MVKINNISFSIEMSDLKFRLGVVWAALTKEYLNFSSKEVTLNDEYINKFKLALKKK